MFKTSPSNAGGVGLIPDQRAKIPRALWPKNQNIKKQKQYYSRFNKDFKNGPNQKKSFVIKNSKLHTIGINFELLSLEQDSWKIIILVVYLS